jgi:hypothetical protein
MALGVASAQDIRNLFVYVHAAMRILGRRNPDSIEERICKTIDGVGDSEEIPFSESQSRIVKLNPNQERGFIGPEANKFAVQHHLLGPNTGHHVLWDTLQNDARQFRLLQDRSDQMLNHSTLVWRSHVASVIHEPGNSYDGLPFWSASHLVNPQRVGLGVQSNILPATNLDRNGVIAAIQRLIGMKNHAGELLNSDPVPLIVVPTFDMEVRAREAINNATVPVAVGANAAVGIENQLKLAMEKMGMAQVERYPELASLSTKRWYVFDLSDPYDRAFYLSKVRNATFGYDGLSANDEARKRRYRVEFWWDAYGGCAPGRHQRSVRGEEV